MMSTIRNIFVVSLMGYALIVPFQTIADDAPPRGMTAAATDAIQRFPIGAKYLINCAGTRPVIPKPVDFEAATRDRALAIDSWVYADALTPLLEVAGGNEKLF